LFIHCTATPEGMEVDGCNVKKWHNGPRDLQDGRVRFMGKNYASREDLPRVEICGTPIKNLRGRGWSRVGYSVLFKLNGEQVHFEQWDGDKFIDPDEITNGAAGFNSVSRHICYAGGLDSNAKSSKDTRTEEQLEALRCFVANEVSIHESIKVVGHNQVSAKDCPSFDVPAWLESVGLERYIFRPSK